MKTQLQEIYNYIIFIEFNEFWNIVISKIPALIIFFSVLFIFFYLNRSKGFIRRAIASANRKKLEEIANEHREIIPEVSQILYTGLQNLSYIIQNKESLSEDWLHEHCKNINNKNLNLIIGKNKSHSFYIPKFRLNYLKEIENIEKIYEKVQSKPSFYNNLMTYFLRLSSKLEGYKLFNI